MHPLGQIALVALGSALGGTARWGLGLAVARGFDVARFPLHTLAINALGCLLLGWFMARFEAHALPVAWLSRDDLRLFVAVGFTGGFTTFSTFAFETHDLAGVGRQLAAIGYVALSVSLGLLALHLGGRLGR